MLYKKPDIRYVDMCIFIDEKVASGNATEQDIDLIYQYLYHLIFMLAHKHKYFKASHYYEEFAIWLAGTLLCRLFYNPHLNEVDENGEPRLKPIKSILNYLKAILYGRKVVFEQQFYSQKISEKKESSDEIITSQYSFMNQIRSSLEAENETNISLYFDSLAKTIKHFLLQECIYKNDKILFKNIYQSCMLSLLNSITFTEEVLNNLKNTYTTPDAKFNYMCKIYADNRKDCVKLYHLDDSFHDYILVMVRKIYKLIQEDFIYLNRYSDYISDDAVANIVFMELDNVDINKE